MADGVKHPRESGTGTHAMDRPRRIAWILILIVDAGLVAWGAMAAWLDQLLALATTAPFRADGRPARPTG